MHNDNDLAMRFTEQHITQLPSLFPQPLYSPSILFLLLCYSVLSSPLFCFSLLISFALAHTSFIYSPLSSAFSLFIISFAAKLSIFPRPHLPVISTSLLLSLSFDSPLPHSNVSLPLSLSSGSFFSL